MDRPLPHLSGGQRRRVALALALLTRPDLLILDEPTNHLDAETVEWLETELLQYPGAVLLVTHDRYFLDRVVTRILEFDVDGVYSYQGNYSIYTEKKLERMALRQRTEDKRLKLLERELAWLRRSPSARTGKQRARVNRAEDLMDQRGPRQEQGLKLDFQADQDHGGIILEAYGLSKRYDDRDVLRDVHLMMQRKDKLGLLGPNGAGKSTLLRLLTGQERPDSGSVRLGNRTTIAIMGQDRDGLDPDQTVYDSLGDAEHVRIGERRVHKRTWLREFLFEGDQQNKKIASLSGGERCRLLLAHLMAQNANLIILDEPTNDLDITSLQFLEDAICEFDGCVLLVTHDRYFLNRVVNALLVFEDHQLTRYDGDYEFYRQRRDEREAALKEARAAQKRDEAQRAKAAAPALATSDRRLSWKEKKELEGMEATILQAEERKAALEAKLSDPALYQKAAAEAAALSQRLQELNLDIERLYERWQELEARA
jgi:ATP-binding cassette subfamily F protein uup